MREYEYIRKTKEDEETPSTNFHRAFIPRKKILFSFLHTSLDHS